MNLPVNYGIHLFYTALILFYLIVTFLFFWTLIKKKNSAYQKESEEIKRTYLELIDQMNYVASENMIALEEKTMELRKLLDKLEKEKMSIEELVLKLEEYRNTVQQSEYLYPSPKKSELKENVYQEDEIKSNLMSKMATDIILNSSDSYSNSFKKGEEKVITKDNFFLTSALNKAEDAFEKFNNLQSNFTNKNSSAFIKQDLLIKKEKVSDKDIFADIPLSHTSSSSGKNKKYDQVLELYYREGYSIDEIVKTLGLKKGTVRLLLSLAESKNQQNNVMKM